MDLPKPKSGILDITPYKGGEGALAEGKHPPVRLASNENALGTGPKAKEALKNLQNLHRYPEGQSLDLRKALAAHHDLPLDQIVCGAGSDELITLLINAYAGPGDEIIHSRHGFMMYAIAARLAGAKPVPAEENTLKADVDFLLKAVTPKTKLLFLANPNNPTGSWLTEEELVFLRKNLPDPVILVIDSAYAEYGLDTPGYTAGEGLVRDFPNTVMLRTFSKIYGLAALRVGWGFFPPHIADVLHRIRKPFNVNTAGQVVAQAALQDTDFLKTSVAHNKKWRFWMEEELKDLGLVVFPSLGNFILADFGEEAEETRLYLKSKNIFVRQMGAHHLPECLRITVGTEEENHILIKALQEQG